MQAPLGEHLWKMWCGGEGLRPLYVTILNVTDPNSTVVWEGDGHEYTIPTLVETEPALRSVVDAATVQSMTMQFSTPIRPGVMGLSTGIVPKDFDMAAFADVVIDDGQVSLSFSRPLAPGTRY